MSMVRDLKVRNGSGTETPCVFGTSGSMRFAAFELRSQACQEETFFKRHEEALERQWGGMHIAHAWDIVEWASSGALGSCELG
jgi:hypothetical protein